LVLETPRKNKTDNIGGDFLDKNQIISEIFEIRGNSEKEKIGLLKENLAGYLNNNNDDQMADFLRFLEICEIEREANDFEKSYEIAFPVFERLLKSNDWDFIDITILSIFIDYSETYIKAHELIEVAVDKLKKLVDSKKYDDTKLKFHIHFLLRLMRAKFHDLQNKATIKEIKNLQEMFEFHANAAQEICNTHGYNIYNAVITIRRGIFHDDKALISKGFDTLEKAGKMDMYKMLQDEAKEYKLHSAITVSKKEYNEAIGKRIAIQRDDLDMSVEEAADALGISPDTMKGIESGEIGLSFHELKKLSIIFDISTYSLFEKFEKGKDGGYVPSDTYKEILIDDLVVRSRFLTTSQLEMAVVIIKNLPGYEDMSFKDFITNVLGKKKALYLEGRI
jgi:transcriptional regulator with XRE-family HTH domain